MAEKTEISEISSADAQDAKGSSKLMDRDRQEYRTMSWYFCSLIMAAETISLGVLSLPWAMAQLGLIP
jgi:hypothetical protein